MVAAAFSPNKVVRKMQYVANTIEHNTTRNIHHAFNQARYNRRNEGSHSHWASDAFHRHRREAASSRLK
jgi:hypothetical protein